MKTDPVTDTDLHAYIDGELTPARRAEVDAWLAANPDDAARISIFQTQQADLRRCFDTVLNEPIPEALIALTQTETPAASRQARWPVHLWQRIAASIAIVCVSAAAGWVIRDQTLPSATIAQAVPLPRQAAIAHVVFSPDIKRPVEITGENETQLITWLSKRLGAEVRAPKLGIRGYELIGGRLLPGNTGPVAQFMYQDASGQRLTLYVSTENAGNRDTAFRFAQEGPLNVFYWIDGKFGYALSGAIPRRDLGQIATVVYDQLGTHSP